MKKNSIFWMFAMLMLVVGMSSCKNDDESNDKKDDRYIITGQPSTIGFSHAILTACTGGQAPCARGRLSQDDVQPS